jgi:REP element-mobilizing transposase RayT
MHLVFAVRNRKASIKREWKNDLLKYITGVIQNNNHKLLAINAMPDHIHILIGYNINHSIPDLVKRIKVSSNNWINNNNLCECSFAWQNGYGCFSHSRKQIDGVIKYINNQEKHHQKKPFRDEYLEILNKNEIKFSNDFLFDFWD